MHPAAIHYLFVWNMIKSKKSQNVFFFPYHNNLPIHMQHIGDHLDYLMYLMKGRVHESPKIQLKMDRARIAYYRFMYERFPLPTTLMEDSL